MKKMRIRNSHNQKAQPLDAEKRRDEKESILKALSKLKT